MKLQESIVKMLERLAGGAYYARGKQYFADGRVRWLDLDEENRIGAQVKGTRNYRVQLWEEDGGLGYECDCPVGEDGAFCKHCVAVALAWLAEHDQESVPMTADSPRRGSGAMAEIREYLGLLEPSALIGLLLEACGRDSGFREGLRLKASRLKGDSSAIKGWKESFKRATATRGFVEYDEMPEFVAGIEMVVEALGDWIDDGRAALVVDLAEQATSRLEEIMGECDDSNGDLGGVLQRLADIHLNACEIARPNPEVLAEKLFQFEAQQGWVGFYNAVERYAEVLGEAGLAAYRGLAEAAWAKVPALAPGDGRGERWEGRRSAITRIMETLALRQGDIDALVAVKARDLSSAWRFLEIAEIYRQADAPDQALEWAERGLSAFPERTDSRLRDFLIAEYRRRGRGEESLALAWKTFEEDPRLPAYTKLHQLAKELDALVPWREKALGYLRQEIQRRFQTGSRSGLGRISAKPDQSPLVEILLWEEALESAWQEAKAGFCRDDLWLRLADRRAQEHPQEAVAVYRRLVDALVEQTNNRAYEEAIALVEKIRSLAGRGVEPSWDDYLDELRFRFKAKRNFMKLLAGLGGATKSQGTN